MIGINTATMNQLETRRFYRRLMGACLAVGIVAYVVGLLLGYIILGTAVYWAGFLGMVGVWKRTSIELYDEREQQIELEASRWTLEVFAYVLVLGGPGLVAFEATGYYDASPELWGTFYAYCALSLVFGAIYTVHRYRS